MFCIQILKSFKLILKIPTREWPSPSLHIPQVPYPPEKQTHPFPNRPSYCCPCVYTGGSSGPERSSHPPRSQSFFEGQFPPPLWNKTRHLSLKLTLFSQSLDLFAPGHTLGRTVISMQDWFYILEEAAWGQVFPTLAWAPFESSAPTSGDDSVQVRTQEWWPSHQGHQN